MNIKAKAAQQLHVQKGEHPSVWLSCSGVVDFDNSVLALSAFIPSASSEQGKQVSASNKNAMMKEKSFIAAKITKEMKTGGSYTLLYFSSILYDPALI